MKTPVDWSVYLVTDRSYRPDRSVLDVVRLAIRGGVTVVQLRDKSTEVRRMMELGSALLPLTRAAGIPLIVNDRVDVALALEADGVHVGQSDLPAVDTRRLIGPERWLGVSVTNEEETHQALRDGADYLGAGDVFGTPSKPDACPPIGTDNLRRIAQVSKVPVVAIGGITLANAPEAIRCGCEGVAVISAVFRADDPEAATRALADTIHNARTQSRTYQI